MQQYMDYGIMYGASEVTCHMLRKLYFPSILAAINVASQVICCNCCQVIVLLYSISKLQQGKITLTIVWFKWLWSILVSR